MGQLTIVTVPTSDLMFLRRRGADMGCVKGLLVALPLLGEWDLSSSTISQVSLLESMKSCEARAAIGVILS